MGGIVRAIAAALKAAFASMARWCSKTGTWVYDRVVSPGVGYFHQAVGGAGAAVTGLIPDVVKGVAKLPGQLICGTSAVLEGGGKAAGATLSVAAALPQALATGLAGGRGAMPAPAPQPRRSGAAEEIADALGALEATRGAQETLRSMRSYSPVSMEADIVHRYAAADPIERDAIDLDELPPHLSDWLEGLTGRQLEHLAQSRAICEEAVCGRRTGHVGMPIPAHPTMSADVRHAEHIGSVGQIVGDPISFSARIAAAKGIRTDRLPH